MLFTSAVLLLFPPTTTNLSGTHITSNGYIGNYYTVTVCLTRVREDCYNATVFHDENFRNVPISQASLNRGVLARSGPLSWRLHLHYEHPPGRGGGWQSSQEIMWVFNRRRWEYRYANEHIVIQSK
jgi:hypothetical protein